MLLRFDDEPGRGVRYLLQKGADPHAMVERLGLSSFLFAVRLENSVYTQIFVEEKIDINFNYRLRRPTMPTALFHAVAANRIESLEILLERGADTEVRTENGVTVLLFAIPVWRDVFVLLSHGADYTVENTAGYTLGGALETIRYTPPSDGTPDWRSKVVTFLRGEDVEVSPWQPSSAE